MRIKLTFLGAAQCVTGSKYLVEANDVKFLVDCGVYQERRLKRRDWERFHIPPATLDAVLLTHAHLDHCGLLPKLVHEGFKSPIYCTTATAEIAKIVLLDSAKLLEEDAEFKKRRHKRERRRGPYPEIPLYTMDDAEASLSLLSPVRYGETVEIDEGIEATFYDAGHILGSSMVKLRVQQNGDERIILFSGDVGGWGRLILRNPTLFEEADYVLVESTYGDRLLDSVGDTANELAEVINSTAEAGGNVIIPSFAVERAQEVLYYLNKFLNENRIPHLMVFVDSPMAVSVTDVFEHHHELFNEEMLRLLRQDKAPFDFPRLHLVRTVDESKAINHIKGTIIVIAGSGMCTGGRIKHHLVANISRPESTILFVGYQAVGTLGRQIVNGAKRVRILGQHYPVKARVVQVNGFSAHADRDELFRWLSGLKRSPKRLFITHGEPDSSRSFAGFVGGKTGWEITIPKYKDSFILD